MVGWVPSITSISDVVYPRITKNISSDISRPRTAAWYPSLCWGQRVAAGHHYHFVTFLTSAPHVTIRQFRVICPVVLRRTANDYKYL